MPSADSVATAALRPAQRISVSSRYLSRTQTRAAIATVLFPSLGLFAAVALAPPIGGHGVALFAIMYVATSLGISVGYHRHVAHRAFSATPAVRTALVALGSMAGQGPVIHWVSNHRRHHRFSDRDGDPHSPHVVRGRSASRMLGLRHAHLGWLFSGDVTNPTVFAKDLLRDPLLLRMNRQYLAWLAAGIFAPAVVLGVATRSWRGALEGFLWGGLARLCIAHHATWSINSLTHVSGSSPHDTGDRSKNNLWLAIPTMGEGWHNNHHAFPRSAFFGLKPWQLDPGAWLVRSLAAFGLAWDVKRPRDLAAAREVSPPA